MIIANGTGTVSGEEGEKEKEKKFDEPAPIHFWVSPILLK